MEMPHRISSTPALRLFITWLGLAAAPAFAANDSPYLSGDWNGERTRLAERGIAFDFGYTGEAAHNVSGGTRQTARYADQWSFGSTLDLEKLWGWRGGTFQVAITNRNGRNLSDDANLGAYQQGQEVYGRGETWCLMLFAMTET